MVKAVVALALALASLAAAPRAVAQTLTWEDVLAQARVRAPAAITAEQGVRGARADAEGAGRWPRTNPVVRLSGDYEIDDDPSHMYGVGVEQEFDVAGLAAARGRQARAAVRVAQQSARVQLLDALRDAGEAFVSLDVAQRSVEVWTDLARMYDQIAAAAARTEAAGVTSRQQTLLAMIEQTSIVADQNAALAERARARAVLALVVGADRSDALAVSSPEDLPPPDARDVNALVAVALARRPDLAALRAQIDEANRRATAAALALVPAPSVTLGVRRERAVTDPDELRPNAAGQIGLGSIDHRSIMVFADVSFPLPLFDRNQAERARAQADAANARENVDLARRRIRAELAGAVAARDAAWATYERWRATRGALDEAQALTRRGYDAGEVGIVPTLVALERVARGRLAYLRARGEYARARVALLRATGELL